MKTANKFIEDDRKKTFLGHTLKKCQVVKALLKNSKDHHARVITKIHQQIKLDGLEDLRITANY